MFDRVKPCFYGVTRGGFIFCALSFMAAISCSGATLQPVVVTKQVQMRPREIVVAVLGAELPAMPGSGKPSVEAVISHWQRQMASELASKPDLIVLPEICDIFGGMGGEAKRAWFLGSAIGRLESTVLNPVGEVTKRSTCYYSNFTTTINTNCRLAHLDHNRAKLQAARDKYGRRVEVHDPGNLGAVLVTSNDPDLPVDKVIEELGIEPWDDYYRRSSDARDKALEK